MVWVPDAMPGVVELVRVVVVVGELVCETVLEDELVAVWLLVVVFVEGGGIPPAVVIPTCVLEVVLVLCVLEILLVLVEVVGLVVDVVVLVVELEPRSSTSTASL